MKARTFALAGFGVAAAVLYGMNASWLAPAPVDRPQLLAHRGVYQPFDGRGLGLYGCTATHIYKPTHNLLENTLPSMRAAFADGADTVGVMVHPTTDGQFVAFHDWTLDCRTDGHGVTRDHTLAELKALDIGYGYTYDGGRTFPFRGAFKGAMPSLAEALDAFPDKRFLIVTKSNDPGEADQLDAYLKAHPEIDPKRLSVAAPGDRLARRLEQLRPGLPVFSPASLKACAFGYLALGWTGYMPRACRNTTLLLPTNYTWLAWGYPNRLQARFRAAGSYIYLIGPHKPKDEGMDGINTPQQLAKVPKSWGMGIWTDRIETIGPLMKGRPRAQPAT
jgi:glycerophosphoryl diester phosphodiesterase